MLRRNLLKGLLAVPLGLLFGKKTEGQPEATQEDIDKWLKDCGDMIAGKMGWPEGSVELAMKRIDESKANWIGDAKWMRLYITSTDMNTGNVEITAYLDKWGFPKSQIKET